MPRAGELVVVPALALLLTLAAADDSHGHHQCGAQGTYAPGSIYETNLRRLAATVAAEVNASGCNCSSGRVAGDDLPDQISASASCPSYRGANAPADCGVCVALAFREAQRLCPYHRQADVVVEAGACSVSFREVRDLDLVFDDDDYFTVIPGAIEAAPSWWLYRALGRLDRDILFMLLFQATGILCVVLMLLVEWRCRVIS